MSLLNHFLITRIAIQASKWGSGLSDEWFAAREALFERYYAATVNSQSDTRFTVLLCLDARFAGRAEAFRRLLEVPVAVVLTGSSWKEAVVSELKTRASGSMVTTGLDSDDGVAVDFVERIRADVRPDHALNFVDGLQYSTTTGAIVHRQKRSNPFISRHSSVGEWVFDTTGHKKVAGRVPTIEVRGVPMWLQVIHGGNVSNEFGDKFRPERPARVAERFPAHFERLQSGPAFWGNVLRHSARTSLDRIAAMSARLRFNQGA
jgi:hypothetical protein